LGGRLVPIVSGTGGNDRYDEFTANADLMAVILVVEDDIFILNSLEGIIEDLGHTPLLASNLAEALAHIVTPHPIDALFVDIRLEALTFGGYDVANQATALRPDLPVLYTSGSPLTDEMTGRFVQGGRFLQKPYSPAQLEASLGELLH
jgi:CheY-like chemotaxis protein